MLTQIIDIVVRARQTPFYKYVFIKKNILYKNILAVNQLIR
jgi:hypothetical protein